MILRTNTHSAPSVGFVYGARAFIPGRAAGETRSIDTPDRSPGGVRGGNRSGSDKPHPARGAGGNRLGFRNRFPLVGAG